MKDLLDLDKLLTVDSKKCVLLYFLGFKVTRGVDFQICGCEVNFLLQGIFALKTIGKLNFLQWRGQAWYKQKWLTTGSSKKLFLRWFFCAANSSVLVLIVQSIQCF
jgi:hypothetical protein